MTHHLQLEPLGTGGAWPGGGIMIWNNAEQSSAYIGSRPYPLVEIVESGPVYLRVAYNVGVPLMLGNDYFGFLGSGGHFVGLTLGSVSDSDGDGHITLSELGASFHGVPVSFKNLAGNDVTESVTDVDVIRRI